MRTHVHGHAHTLRTPQKDWNAPPPTGDVEMQPTAAAAAQETAKKKAAEEKAAEEKARKEEEEEALAALKRAEEEKKRQADAAEREAAKKVAGPSVSSALPPPTPGYETAKGWNALPPAAGDVEVRPTKTTTDETVGVDTPALPQSTGEHLPGTGASRLSRMASLDAALLGDGAGNEAADAPLADRALTTINRSQSAQL